MWNHIQAAVYLQQKGIQYVHNYNNTVCRVTFTLLYCKIFDILI